MDSAIACAGNTSAPLTETNPIDTLAAGFRYRDESGQYVGFHYREASDQYAGARYRDEFV